MSTARRNFDGLARIYRVLEFLAFGRDLERARFCHLAELRDCREILVLGEGDGRCLAQLVRLAPASHVHCIDASAGMLTRAAARLTDDSVRARVSFEHADALTCVLPAAHYDAVVTLFFLDCFTPENAAALITRISASLRPDARWVFADFSLPVRGWARWRAQLWLTGLYAFFRWRTGLAARALPPSEALLVTAGWRERHRTTLQHGLLTSAVFRREDSAPVAG